MAATYRAPTAIGEIYDPRLNRMSELLKAGTADIGGSVGEFTPGGFNYVPNYGAIIKPVTDFATNYFKQKEDADIAAQDQKQLSDWIDTTPKGSIKQGMGPLIDQSNIAPPTRADRQAFLLRGMSGIQDPEMKGAITKAYLDDAINPKQRTPYVTNLTTGFQVDPDNGEVRSIPEVQAYNQQMRDSQYDDRAALKQMMIDAQQGRLSQSIGAQDQRQQRNIDALNNRQERGFEGQMGVHEANRLFDINNPTNPEKVDLQNKVLEQTLKKRTQEASKLPPIPTPVMNNVSEMADMYDTLNRLKTTFNPEFAGHPGKKAVTVMAKKLGDLAPEEVRAHGEWWGLNERLSNIPERLKVFGATLTPSEEEAWNNATFDEGTNSDQLVRNFQIRMDIFNSKLAGIRRSEKQAGRNYKQIDAYLGDRANDLWPEEAGALTAKEMNDLIATESSGRSNAVSPKGAQGITQIMPETAAQPGYGMEPIDLKAATDAEKIDWSNRYIGAMMKAHKLTKAQAVSAYHMGPGNVMKNNKTIVDPKYVGSVLKQSNPSKAALKTTLSDEELMNKYRSK